MENKDNFEQVFIKLVAERVEDAGLSHSAFGKRVFGEASGVRLWRACRDMEKRRRKLTLDEAYRMAEALGTDFPTMVWNIAQAARSRGMISDDQNKLLK